MRRLIIIVAIFFPITFVSAQTLDLESFSLPHCSFYAPVVSGDYVYCSAHNFLLTVSFADPAHPELVNQQYFQGGSAATMRGNYIYFAGGEDGSLSIVDISNPVNPYISSNLIIPSDTYDLILIGDYAYTIGYNSILSIINISNPANPVISDTITTFHIPYAMAAKDNYIYVAEGDSGLTIINISDPGRPYICARFFPNTLWIPVLYKISIYGNYAYVLDYYNKIYVINISNPVSPEYIRTYYPVGDWLTSVLSKDNRLYCGMASPRGIEIIDISNPVFPSYMKTIPIANHPGHMTFSGSNLYMTSNRDGSGSGVIDMLDTSDPSILYLSGRFEATTYDLRSIALSGNYVFVGSSGFAIMDISDGRHPQKVGQLDCIYATAFTISDSLAYIVSGRQISIYDVSDVQNPVFLGECSIGLDGSDISVVGNYVFISGGDIFVIDAGDPRAPYVVGRYDSQTSMHVCGAAGSYLYAVDDAGGFNVLNINDPSSPEFITRLVLTRGDFSWSMKVKDNYAYLAINNLSGGIAGLKIIDISNPSDPQLVSVLSTNHNTCSGVCVEGDIVYLVSPGIGLLAIDASIPSSPVVVDTAELTDMYGYPQVRNGTIYIADDLSFIIMHYTPGLGIKVESPNDRQITSNCYPNPSNSSFNFEYNLSEASNIELTIFDINGRKVKSISDGYQGPGVHRIDWSAKELSSGIYFYRIKAGDYTETKKMVLLK